MVNHWRSDLSLCTSVVFLIVVAVNVSLVTIIIVSVIAAASIVEIISIFVTTPVML